MLLGKGGFVTQMGNEEPRGQKNFEVKPILQCSALFDSHPQINDKHTLQKPYQHCFEAFQRLYFGSPLDPFWYIDRSNG